MITKLTILFSLIFITLILLSVSCEKEPLIDNSTLRQIPSKPFNESLKRNSGEIFYYTDQGFLDSLFSDITQNPYDEVSIFVQGEALINIDTLLLTNQDIFEIVEAADIESHDGYITHGALLLNPTGSPWSMKKNNHLII